jgi:hypothetical protein
MINKTAIIMVISLIIIEVAGLQRMGIPESTVPPNQALSIADKDQPEAVPEKLLQIQECYLDQLEKTASKNIMASDPKYRNSAMSFWEKVKQYTKQTDKKERDAYSVAMVHPFFIASPIGRWVLLRRGKDLCALRFTDFNRIRTEENLPPSWTRESFFAKYDWYCQSNGSGKFVGAHEERGHGQASRKPNLWRFERGDKHIKCGPLKVQWDYPNRISLVEKDIRSGARKPNDIEIALTGWKDISEVSARDSRLIWYRYDPAHDTGHNYYAQVPDTGPPYYDPSIIPVIIPVEKLPLGLETAK